MIDLLKHKLIALFAVLSVFTVFGFAASKPVAADISYGGAEWTSVNANVNAVTPFTLIINQAMFVYNPGNAQQNNWLNAAGVHASPGQLAIVQWGEYQVNGQWQSKPMSYLRSLFTYSNSITTRFYSDGSAEANATNWNRLVSMSGATQNPRKLAQAGAYFGLGNNTMGDSWDTYGVGGSKFWFSGTYGSGGGVPGGFGHGMGQWPGVGGQNAVGGGLLYRGDELLTIVRANIAPDVVLPTSEKDDAPSNRLAAAKAVTINNVTSSTLAKSKSSDDEASYTVGVDFFSKSAYTYRTYAWAEKDKSYTTKTIENNYQSVINLTDDIPKGFAVSAVEIKTSTGKTLNVETASSPNLGNVASNITKGANKDFAKYYIEAPTSGASGGKVHVQVVSGDMTENAAAGKRNRFEVKLIGKLVPAELPTPDSGTGVGKVSNKAVVNQVVQRWVKASTSAPGTKPQPYTFTASNGFNKNENLYNTNVTTNQVDIAVQAYQMIARYMTLDDDYQPQGNTVGVDIGGKIADNFTSDWTYPKLKTTVPTPRTTKTTETSAIYDRNSQDAVVSKKSGEPWGVTLSDGDSIRLSRIPNSTPVITKLKSEAVLNSGTYTASWYRDVEDLAGNTHRFDQITSLRSGQSLQVDLTADNITFTMGDESRALSLYYGRKLYHVNAKHVTTRDSKPSYTSFDSNRGETELTPSTNTQGPAGSFQVNKGTHTEDYVIHEGEGLDYSPQVLQIRDKSKNLWRLAPVFAQGVPYKFDSGSSPKVDENLTYGELALEYQRSASSLDRAMIAINPEKLTIDTATANGNAPFKLEFSGVYGSKYKFLRDNAVPGFDLANYKFTVTISDGKKAVYTRKLTLAEFSDSNGRLGMQLDGALPTNGYKDGQKTPYSVAITLDKSSLKALQYVGAGSLPINIEQDESTDTPSGSPFSSFGYTKSKLTVTNSDVSDDGQLSIPKDKLVVQTVATRSPYTYVEYYESWTLAIPKDLTTLTGYSMSGMYPISYSIDKVSGKGLIDLNNKFEIRYPRGLNADRTLPDYYNEKKGVTLSAENPTARLDLSNLSEESKDSDKNGVLTRSVTPAVPKVSIKVGSGEVSSQNSPDGQTYLNGGNRIYISDWIDNVPSVQPVIFETRPTVAGLGVNEIKFTFKQNVTLSGYLHGHSKSATQATDAILMQPVDRSSINMTQGFGYSVADNAWLADNNWSN